MIRAIFFTYVNWSIEFTIWKSGLVHYRRYFSGSGEQLKGKRILAEEETLKYLEEFDILMPKKRRYYIETVASHYANAHYQKDMLMTRLKIVDTYLFNAQFVF
jgi:hypothetical protein